MDEFGAEFLRSLSATRGTEWAGAALGLAYVVLAIGQRPACWIAAFLSTALYLYVFAAAGLYMQAALQVYFLAMAVYGWFAWGAAGTRAPLPVSRAGLRLQAWGLLAVAGATVASAWLLRATDAAHPWLDSATTWGSVFATWLVARKKLECWAWWFVIDVAIAVLCWRQRLYPSALLYALYLVLVIVGWRAWSADARRAAAGAANT